MFYVASHYCVTLMFIVLCLCYAYVYCVMLMFIVLCLCYAYVYCVMFMLFASFVITCTHTYPLVIWYTPQFMPLYICSLYIILAPKLYQLHWALLYGQYSTTCYIWTEH